MKNKIKKKHFSEVLKALPYRKKTAKQVFQQADVKMNPDMCEWMKG